MAYDAPMNRAWSPVDPSQFTDGILPSPCSKIHCNTSGTYRVWSSKGSYTDRYLYKGLSYDMEMIVRITDTSDAALSSGLLVAILA